MPEQIVIFSDGPAVAHGDYVRDDHNGCKVGKNVGKLVIL